MEDTTAHWMSVMVVLGQSGTEIRSVLGYSARSSVKLENIPSRVFVTVNVIHLRLYVLTVSVSLSPGVLQFFRTPESTSVPFQDA